MEERGEKTQIALGSNGQSVHEDRAAALTI